MYTQPCMQQDDDLISERVLHADKHTPIVMVQTCCNVQITSLLMWLAWLACTHLQLICQPGVGSAIPCLSYMLYNNADSADGTLSCRAGCLTAMMPC